MWPSTSRPPRIVTSETCVAPSPRHSSTAARQSSGVPLDDVDALLDPDRSGIAARFLGPRPEPLHRRGPAALEGALRKEAVGDPGRPADRNFG